MNENTKFAAVGWPLTLAAAAILGSLALACMMPFVALATLAAVTMSRAQAVITVAGIWAVNQLMGFGMFGYPLNAYALGWGAALGAASMAALVVARSFAGIAPRALPTPMRIAAAFGLAFVSYEVFLFGFALVAGGTETFTAAIVGQILANDALWLVGLGLLYTVLQRTAPNLFGPALALRPR
ncbi:hypothetical protein [Erythrobacter sp. QSSC1-22B]|uniref:hypothetical protein n=1 Tax=Erythrobacter sp. QSSC1-22B TaxID=1860125 RepID=UPI0011AB17AB|nr:hypothetical protein [Erythrobacter sp. QSSC1-22B]